MMTRMDKAAHLVIAAWALTGFLLAVTGCPKPTPGTTHPGVLECSSEVVRAHWPEALPAVNRCLAAAADSAWFDCLVGLINPIAGLTEDVIGCVVRGTGDRYRQASAANPNDEISSTAASRAAEFLTRQGYKFQ
jgi:hypothetical protein